MSTKNCLTWVRDNLTETEIKNKRVIEIGAYDVNGSVRPLIEALNPSEYIGIDMRQGPGVDIVCRAEALVEQFGKNSFDIVISVCAFEHIRYWQEALANIKTICKTDGGIIIFIVPSQWPFHAYPYDFWRYSLTDISYIFSDFDILRLEEIKENMPNCMLVYAKLKKSATVIPINLTNYPLYSVINNKKVSNIRSQDFYTWHFVSLSIIYWFNTLKIPYSIKYIIIYLVMGVKLKIVQPLFRLLGGLGVFLIC